MTKIVRVFGIGGHHACSIRAITPVSIAIACTESRVGSKHAIAWSESTIGPVAAAVTTV